MPINYQNGKIYKIINLENKIVYIGSTAQEKLCDRFKSHKHQGGGNKIILLEDYPCSCKDQLVKKEQEYIEQHSELLNQIRSYNSKEYNDKYNKERKKKYRENNKEELKEKRKEYKENNKEIIKEKDKKYRENNQEKIKEKTKKYYQKNKEKLKEKDKEYYQKNKEELCKKVKCDLCNTEVNKQCLTRHKKSKKCINRICD